MARHEPRIEGDEEASIGVSELMSLIAGRSLDEDARRSAIACFLSASRGWQEAKGSLAGTFNAPGAEEVRLTAGKEE